MGLAGNIQCLQPAIRILEHLVSEDQSPSLVHFVSDGAGSSLALILLLPWRRIFQTRIATAQRSVYPRSVLCFSIMHAESRGHAHTPSSAD